MDKQYIQLPWSAGATGNMTLSVSDAVGLRIARIDMLSAKTMTAGDNGDQLAQALNDLTIITLCPNLAEADAPEKVIGQFILPYSDDALSRGPWKVAGRHNCFTLFDADGRRIAGMSWRGVPKQTLIVAWRIIAHSIPIFWDLFPRHFLR